MVLGSSWEGRRCLLGGVGSRFDYGSRRGWSGVVWFLACDTQRALQLRGG